MNVFIHLAPPINRTNLDDGFNSSFDIGSQLMVSGLKIEREASVTQKLHVSA